MIAGTANGALSDERESPFTGASGTSWLALTFLIIVGLYMYADRTVITLQIDPIKASLGLTDFQIGLVQGVAVALFAALAGYPIAWLADRFDRRLILSVSILIWCAAVAACGLSQDFTQLFLASALVGAGEAALLPITYATIPLLFSGRARLTANAMVTLVGRLASGGVIALSGFLVQHVGRAQPLLPEQFATLENWRLALLALALPGPILALLALALRLRIAVPETRNVSGKATAQPVRPFLAAHLLRSLGPVYLGVGLLIFGISALAAFLPVVAMREMGATPGEVGAGVGAATLVSTVLAMLVIVGLGGALARRMGPAYTVLLLASAAFLSALVSPAFLLVRSAEHIYLLIGVTFLFLSCGAMAFPTALQDLIPTPLRARLIAVAILVNIVLSALAPAVVGFFSDMMGQSGRALLIATVATAATALAISGVLLLFARRGYLATAEAARSLEDQQSRGVTA